MAKLAIDSPLIGQYRFSVSGFNGHRDFSCTGETVGRCGGLTLAQVAGIVPSVNVHTAFELVVCEGRNITVRLLPGIPVGEATVFTKAKGMEWRERIIAETEATHREALAHLNSRGSRGYW